MKLFSRALASIAATVAIVLLGAALLNPVGAQQLGSAVIKNFISRGTPFTIASGCTTVSAIAGGPQAGSFATTATTCAPVITFANAAPNGWNCFAQDITSGHSVVFTQTATTTTSCTVTGTTTSGDTVSFNATGY